MPADDRRRYAAFISYRHVEPDRSVARWLHGALETYRVPAPLVATGARDRLGRVFRDDEELAASADLSAGIDAALRDADALVVLCSPRTPASRWVNEEVVRFRALGRGARIVALLIEGTPEQSFPPALLGAGIEPLAASLCAVEGVAPRETRHLALLKLLAGLLDVRLDDLRRRDEERRRRQLIRWALGAAVAAVAFAALATAALLQWRRAERELQVSRAEALAAQAQLALAQATAAPSDDSALRPDVARSALLALESLQRHPGLVADAVLRRALFALGERLQVRLAPDEVVTGVSPQGELLRARGEAAPAPDEAADDAPLAHSADGRWWLRRSDQGVGGWVFQTGALSRGAGAAPLAWLPHEWMIRRAAFTEDGRWLLTVTAEASADAAAPEATLLVGHTVRVWDVDARTESTRLSLATEGGIEHLWIDPGAEWLATQTTDGEQRVVRLWPVRPQRLRELACQMLTRNLSPSEWLSFVADGTPRATCPGLPVISE